MKLKTKRVEVRGHKGNEPFRLGMMQSVDCDIIVVKDGCFYETVL